MRQLLLNPASSIGGDAIDALCEKVGKTSRQGRQRRHTKELARGNGGSIINSVECLVRLFDLGIDFGVGSSFRNASSFMPVGTCCSSTFFSAVISDCFAVASASRRSTSSARATPARPTTKIGRAHV